MSLEAVFVFPSITNEDKFQKGEIPDGHEHKVTWHLVVFGEVVSRSWTSHMRDYASKSPRRSGVSS